MSASTQPTSLRVRVGTWNVATKNVQDKNIPLFDLSYWLTPPLSLPVSTSICQQLHQHQSIHPIIPHMATETKDALKKADENEPDIVVVGFQELLPQVTAALLPSTQRSHWLTGTGQNKRLGDAYIHGLEPWIWMVQNALRCSSSSSSKEKSTSIQQSVIDDSNSTHTSYRVAFAGRSVAIGIAVFVKHEIVVSRIGWGAVGTGLAGFYGNKGTAAISLDVTTLDNQVHSLCFMSCHLGAHQGEGRCIWRNQEMSSILDTLVMDDITVSANEKRQTTLSQPVVFGTSSNGTGSTLNGIRMVGDHNHIWLFGDLNYRLSGTKKNGGRWAIDDGPVSEIPERSDVLKLVHDGDISGLLCMDEVSCIRGHRYGALGLFDEQPIRFLPTYKFKMDEHYSIQPCAILSNDGDELPRLSCTCMVGGVPAGISKSFSTTRLPAYCDRILHAGCSISGNGYWSEPGYSLSDHVPVCADYLLHPLVLPSISDATAQPDCVKSKDCSGYDADYGHRLNLYRAGKRATTHFAMHNLVLWKRFQRVGYVNRHWISLFVFTALLRFLYRAYII
ncbi:hypothetical protein QVD99_000788 [Batrachochytrium dendrobatidis]|nr:hypothetical protein QVD99_000788 [Batrachochytrium dendrobatidis]